MTALPFSYAGLRLVSDPNMVETVEDWSQVRSPSRAARRRRVGHAQRIRYVTRPMRQVYQVGDAIVGHPDTIRAVMDTVDRQSGACPPHRPQL